MTFSAIAALRAVRDLKLEGLQKLVLFALVSRADEEGTCWPSFATLAADTGLSVRSVKNIVPTLREAGLVLVMSCRKAGSLRPESNRYTVTMVHLLHHQKYRDSDGAGGAPSGGLMVQEVHGMVHHVHFDGAPRAQEVSQEELPKEGGREAAPPVCERSQVGERIRNSADAIALADGITSGSGRPFRVPSTSDYWEWVVPAAEAHAGGLVGEELTAWYVGAGEAYGRAKRGGKLTPMGFALYLDEQARTLQGEALRAKALEGQQRKASRPERRELADVVPLGDVAVHAATALRAMGGWST